MNGRAYPSDLWRAPTPLERLAALADPAGKLAERVRTYDTMSSGTYGCQKCEERKKTGKPADLTTERESNDQYRNQARRQHPDPED